MQEWRKMQNWRMQVLNVINKDCLEIIDFISFFFNMEYIYPLKLKLWNIGDLFSAYILRYFKH